MPAGFLLQQIEWREALDEAKTTENLHEISVRALEFRREKLLKIEHFIDVDRSFNLAIEHVRALMFVERFSTEVDVRLDQLQQ